MLVTQRTIVLHTTRYGDDALICEVLAEQAGVVSLMVRVSRSRRAAVSHTLFSPLALLDLTWNNTSSGIPRCRAAQLSVPLPSIARHPYKSAIALFLSEFLHYAVRLEADPGPLFGYVQRSVQWLDTCQRGFANFHLVFLLHVVRFLGFAPNLEGYRPGCWFDMQAGRFVALRPAHPHVLEPAEAALLPHLRRMDFATMHVFRFTGAERSRLLERINDYYRLHVPAFPQLRSLAVRNQVFS